MKGHFNHKQKTMHLDNGTTIEAGTVGFMGYYASINGVRVPRQFISLDAALSFAIEQNAKVEESHLGNPTWIKNSFDHIKGKI